MKKLMALSVLVTWAGISHANLLSDPGFQSYPNSITDSTLGWLVFSSVTVDEADANFQRLIDEWAVGGAGNGIATPVGSGNDSTRATGNRKAARYFQVLPLNTISNGDQIQVDFQYGVAASYTSNVSFTLQVFAVNQAADGEAATTISNGLALGGETHNRALLATTTVSLTYNVDDPDNDDIDGIWKDAPSTIIDIDQPWDYIGVALRRSSGLTNSTAAQTDNVSIAVIPEPGSIGLALMAVLLVLRCRRSSR